MLIWGSLGFGVWVLGLRESFHGTGLEGISRFNAEYRGLTRNIARPCLRRSFVLFLTQNIAV